MLKNFSQRLESVISIFSNYHLFSDYPDEVPKLEPLDPSTIHTPQLRSSFDTTPSGNQTFPQLSPTSPRNVTSEDDGNNQSNSRDVEMADITNDE